MVRLSRLEESHMETDRIPLNLFLGVMFFIVLTEFMGGWLIREKGISFLAVTGFLRVVQSGGVLVMVMKMSLGLKVIGLEKERLREGIYRGFLWSMGFGIVTLLGFGGLAIAGINPIRLFHAGFLKNGQNLYTYFIVGALIGPVAEEIVFRGIVYGFLRKWGVGVALFITTLLFVGVHGLGAGVPLTQIAGGILFAVAYEKEGNLLVPVIIHVLGNSAIFTLAVLNGVMG